MKVYTELSDLELLSMLRDSNEYAFNIIFKRYWKSLFDEAHKRLRNVMQSEEVIHDVFADLWAKRSGQHIENLLPYLKTAVKYQVFMLYKKEKKLPFFEEPLENMAIASLQADSMLFAKELRACIDTWLEMQPEKRREIFRLRYIDDFSTREISEKLNISQKTVQNTLATALFSLKESLGISMIAVASIISYLSEKTS
jgi:RNA polymerase sigma-70 factor (ECF subfamily)